jgi:DNA polymerase III alpha subunit
LIVRSGFSFKAAVGNLDEVASRLVEVGATTLALTDVNSTHGHVKATAVAEKHGLRMVYGVDLGVTPEVGASRPPLDRWRFLAVEEVRPLYELVKRATRNRIPCLSYAEALAAEGVVRITGEATLVENVPEPAERLFLGLSPGVPRALVRKMLAAGHRPLALSSNRYPREGDFEVYRVGLGSFASSSQTFPQHILSDVEWIEELSWLPRESLMEAIKNRDSVLDRCLAKLKKARLPEVDRAVTLREMCVVGAEKLGVDLHDPVYRLRLDRELGLIAEKDFEDYFRIVADMMEFSRRQMVVGPARGSSCGSLVCYLLGITGVDPIVHDLVFERFIDVTRSDLPDIDLDFSEERRKISLDYVAEKYGRERTARLGSVNQFKTKAALRQIGAALKIPTWRINEVSNTVVKRSQGDSRASSAIADTFVDTEAGRKFIEEFPEASIAGRLEWHPAAAGQHAAGIVVTSDDILNYVAIDGKTGASMCDKRDAEVLNLLKIDALGLSQLTTFEHALELIGVRPEDWNGFLERIPLDENRVLDCLNDGRFSGIFQFTPETTASGLVRQLLLQGGRMETLEDIVAMTALVRPGPLGSGAADTWIRRKTGGDEVRYPYPILEPYLSRTLGIVIYQEQVLQIGREVGDLTWEDVTALRKAMSKSLGREYFDRYGDRWKAGAIEKGIPPAIAGRFWEDLCQYGLWAFNRSHSVAYGIISFWCCWMKYHHPVEFAAATMDAHPDPETQIPVLRELRREGIDYIPVDPDVSTDRWTLSQRDGRTVLVGPIGGVIGIGPRTVSDVLDARRTGEPLRPSVRKKLEKPRTKIDSLFPIRDAFEARRASLIRRRIVSAPTGWIEELVGGDSAVVYGLITKVSPVFENQPARIVKRGYALPEHEPLDSVNFWVRDDTGEILCKIDRRKVSMVQNFVQTAREKKSLFCLKGRVLPGFRMIMVDDYRHVGEIDGDPEDTDPVAADIVGAGDAEGSRPDADDGHVPRVEGGECGRVHGQMALFPAR